MKSEPLNTISDSKLIQFWVEYNEIIEVAGCYSVKDLIIRNQIEVELNNRGYSTEQQDRIVLFNPSCDEVARV